MILYKWDRVVTFVQCFKFLTFYGIGIYGSLPEKLIECSKVDSNHLNIFILNLFIQKIELTKNPLIKT